MFESAEPVKPVVEIHPERAAPAELENLEAGLNGDTDPEELLFLCVGIISDLEPAWADRLNSGLNTCRKKCDLINQLAETVLTLDDLPCVSPSENQIKARGFRQYIACQLAILLKGTDTDRDAILVSEDELQALCRKLETWAKN